MESVAVKDTKKTFWTQILKGVLLATSFSLVAILILALIIVYVGVSEKVIMPVNQVIKILSILFGTWFALKKSSGKGLVKGAFIGFIYSIFAYVLFSALSQEFVFNLSLLNDILFGAIIGAICGVIVVNLRR